MRTPGSLRGVSVTHSDSCCSVVPVMTAFESMTPVLRVACVLFRHPMDDYYRKLFKSLHKNKEEMLRLMEEQSLFQLSQVGLKVCIQTLPHAALHIFLCRVQLYLPLTMFNLLAACNRRQTHC